MFSSRSFFSSLFLGNLSLIVVIFGAGFFAITHEVNVRAVQLTERFQEQLLALTVSDFHDSWPNVDERIVQYTRSYGREPEFRLTVVDGQGRVLGDSEYPSEKMEPHRSEDRPEILTALGGNRGEAVRESKTKRISYRYLAEPVRVDGKVVAVIRIAFPVAGFMENRQQLFRGVLFGFSLMLVAGTALSILLSWLWYRPLRLINDAAQHIAKGNLEPAPPIDGPLEMNQLSKALETMRRTVVAQLATISRQREGLQTILRNLPDAILAMNRSDHILYFNDAAGKLFRLEPFEEPPFFQNILRNAAIIDFYRNRQDVLSNTPSADAVERKEIDLFGQKRFLELELIETGSETDNDAAWLLIVSDLTESVRAHRMKIDFVANASHELRTPLAAIRAALDNVSDDVYDDKETLEKIIRIVDRHVARLDALIEDLLSLHSAEDESIAGRTERTSVAEQRCWIEELFQQKVAAKNLHFSIESTLDAETFSVDNKRLGLILQNLVDNAVKFAPENGSVTLRFERDDRNLVVVCKDTGCGIASEEQDRVFERFYQGGSSKTGDGRIRGTGLGLAIVKHAVERLRGNISLCSRPGQGTEFTIRLPVF